MEGYNMSDFKKVVFSALEEYSSDLWEKIDGLTTEELRWQPSLGSNDIQWNVWHMIRVEDTWVNKRLKSEEEIWITNGWYKQFGMKTTDHGARKSPDEVRSIPTIKMGELKEYFLEVRKSTLEYVQQMDQNQLEKVYTENGKNGTWIIGHLLVEESQHLGQIAYIRGIIRGFDN